MILMYLGRDMLAENLKLILEQERQRGRQENANKIALRLLELDLLSDEQICVATRLSLEELEALKQNQVHTEAKPPELGFTYCLNSSTALFRPHTLAIFRIPMPMEKTIQLFLFGILAGKGFYIFRYTLHPHC